MTTVPVPSRGADPRGRTQLERLLGAFPAVVLAIVVASFYVIEAYSRKTPWIFGDELEWTQISRSIAATGHSARRTEPIFWKSLYAWLVAPCWWIASTASAYDAVKLVNALVMPLAAIPTYRLARMFVPKRSATVVAVLAVVIPGMAYVTSILPEVLFYPYYALASWLAVRAFASGRRLDIALALVVVLGGYLVKQAESTILPAAFFIAAAGLWLTGPRGRSMRRTWTRGDTIGAIVLGFGAFYLFNRVVLQHIHEWQFTTEHYRHRMFSLGLQTGFAFTIGMGVLPVVAGLASLRLPERKGDPAYRAFAAWTAASVLSVSVYAALKSAYLSTNYGTSPEERNLFYLAPLLLTGSALVVAARKVDWRLLAFATALIAFLLVDEPFQLSLGYFEAPGFSVAAALHLHHGFSETELRTLLLLMLGASLLAVWARRLRPVVLAATLGVGIWLVAGELEMTSAIDQQATAYYGNLPKPVDWVDRATGGAKVTYLGQSLASQDGEWLTEFWNRSIDHVYGLDGTVGGPGPFAIPTLLKPNGLLSDSTGDPYVLADSGIRLNAPVVARAGAMTLYRQIGFWHLLDTVSGVYSDGWCSASCAYTYFKPGQHGVLEVTLSRTAYNGTAPAADATLSAGAVLISDAEEPVIDKVTTTVTAVVANGTQRTIRIPVDRTPVRVEVAISDPIPPSATDARSLGAQVGFRFVRR